MTIDSLIQEYRGSESVFHASSTALRKGHTLFFLASDSSGRYLFTSSMYPILWWWHLSCLLSARCLVQESLGLGSCLVFWFVCLFVYQNIIFPALLFNLLNFQFTEKKCELKSNRLAIQTLNHQKNTMSNKTRYCTRHKDNSNFPEFQITIWAVVTNLSMASIYISIPRYSTLIIFTLVPNYWSSCL